jgi:hypothetical protein
MTYYVLFFIRRPPATTRDMKRDMTMSVARDKALFKTVQDVLRQVARANH